MRYTIAEIAAAIGAEAAGDLSIAVTGRGGAGAAGPDDLALAMSPDYADALRAGRARAAVVWGRGGLAGLRLEAAIMVPRGRLAMARLTAHLDSGRPGRWACIRRRWWSRARGWGGCVVGPFAVIGAGPRSGTEAGSRTM